MQGGGASWTFGKPGNGPDAAPASFEARAICYQDVIVTAENAAAAQDDGVDFEMDDPAIGMTAGFSVPAAAKSKETLPVNFFGEVFRDQFLIERF